MLKTISAALLAVSVLAAPAMAAGSAKTTEAPAVKAAKTSQAPVIKAAKTTQAPVIKAEQVKPKAAQVKPSVLNANARMGHHKHFRHHRSHKHMGALKSHQFSKVTIKHVAPATKRG
jgi:hypothetical protein